MLKRLFNSAAAGLVFALAALVTGAFALSITGRDSQFQRSILQAGIPAVSTELAITASTTQTLAGAYQLSAGFSQVGTASSNDAVKLPSLTALGSPSNLDASLNMVIANNTANSITVFPFASTDVIVVGNTALGAGAAFTLTTLKVMECWSASSGRWYCTAS